MTDVLRKRIFSRRDSCPSPAYPIINVKDIKKIEKQAADPSNKTSVVMDTLSISRPLRTRTISVNTNPILILRPPHVWPYLLSNPTSISSGITSSTNIHNGNVVANGDTTLVPLGVSSFLNMHMHIDISAVSAGSIWNIIAQSRDPFSGNWGDSQVLVAGITPATLGLKYIFLGEQGIASDFAIRWENVGAVGNMTFSATCSLKAGTGEIVGLARAIFIGGKDVTTANGWPLEEGKEKIVNLGSDIELYAVSNVPTTIKIFTL